MISGHDMVMDAKHAYEKFIYATYMDLDIINID